MKITSVGSNKALSPISLNSNFSALVPPPVGTNDYKRHLARHHCETQCVSVSAAEPWWTTSLVWLIGTRHALCLQNARSNSSELRLKYWSSDDVPTGRRGWAGAAMSRGVETAAEACSCCPPESTVPGSPTPRTYTHTHQFLTALHTFHWHSRKSQEAGGDDEMRVMWGLTVMRPRCSKRFAFPLSNLQNVEVWNATSLKINRLTTVTFSENRCDIFADKTKHLIC